jgi:murein DD-endopeptidase MepM/ murein hydrolase activator NlpD
MRRLLTFIKHNGPLLPMLMLIVIAVAAAAYLSGTIGVTRPRVRSLPTQIATAVPPLPGTPVTRFFQLNPAIISYLDVGQPSYGVVPLDALGLDVQPVGAFLPSSGNTQFDLSGPTPLPTPLPYPTSPPLPLPHVPETILPTVPAVDENGVPRTIPYDVPAEVDCAPAGNPVDGILTQRFHLYHSGIDLAVPLGTPVLATHSGQVTYADWSDIGYGYLVIVQSGPFITYYAHNTSFNITSGQFVGKGSIIAWSGSTGNSTGPHVHYEVRINDVPVDPLTFESRGYPTC